jgi:hypothetical protein
MNFPCRLCLESWALIFDMWIRNAFYIWSSIKSKTRRSGITFVRGKPSKSKTKNHHDGRFVMSPSPRCNIFFIFIFMQVCLETTGEHTALAGTSQMLSL